MLETSFLAIVMGIPLIVAFVYSWIANRKPKWIDNYLEWPQEEYMRGNKPNNAFKIKIYGTMFLVWAGYSIAIYQSAASVIQLFGHTDEDLSFGLYPVAVLFAPLIMPKTV